MRFIHPFLTILLIGTALSGAAAQPQIGPSAIVVNPVPSFTAEVSVDRDASVSLSRNNPWHGRTLSAAVRTTVLRGRPTVLDGELVDP